MCTMPTALEVELKTYAHEFIADHLKEEYDSQIRKWQQHINRMVDAQTEALNSHLKVLDDARKQIEAERQAAFGLAMLALSLVTGPVLAWIGSKIQYTWFPKYTETVSSRFTRLNTSSGVEWKKLYVLGHDPVWAQVFGQVGQQIAGFGIDKAIKVVTPDSNGAQTAIQDAASSDQGSFKTRLENALLAEADLTSKAIMSVAMGVHENENYGAECLEKLKKVNPQAKQPKVNEKDLERMAKAMIKDDINKQRQEWADKWFYYGNDPGPIGGMARSIEIELWGLWLLNEKLKLVTESGVHDPLEDYGAASLTYTVSKTFGNVGIPNGVLIRLAEFGVIEAQTELQKLRAIAAREAQEQMAAATARVREAQEQKDAALEEQIENLEDDRAANPELARFNRGMARAAKKSVTRRPGVVAPATDDPDRPLISVGKMVDTQGEINALETWATKHPPQMGSGQMTHHKRTLESIENIYRSK